MIAIICMVISLALVVGGYIDLCIKYSRTDKSYDSLSKKYTRVYCDNINLRIEVERLNRQMVWENKPKSKIWEVN